MTTLKDISRRSFLASGAAAVAIPAVSLASPILAGITTRALGLPAAKGPRAVIVGGGWAGLTLAKHLRSGKPEFDVVLVERSRIFHSFPLSNLWLANEVSLSFLSHSYIDAARNHDYVYVNTTALDADRERRRLYTSHGYVDYDYLILAPGIDYDYERTGLEDPEAIREVSYRYPGGFVSMSEIVAIKRKIWDFSGGVFALTVPNDNYRCMAAPYERACMAASIFKKRGVKAKVLLLDMNNAITVKRNGFTRAFEELFPDYIDYQSSSEIASIDPFNRVIATDFDEYPFDDAIIYPKIRASRLIENLGLMNPDAPQKTATIDTFKYHLPDNDRVYVIGDARSQAFSKSGNTAKTEALYIARLIAAHATGREIPWEGPQTMCFSAVRLEPLEAMSLIANYKYNEETDAFGFDKVHVIENWNEQIATAGKVWANEMFRDMFYA